MKRLLLSLVAVWGILGGVFLFAQFSARPAAALACGTGGLPQGVCVANSPFDKLSAVDQAKAYSEMMILRDADCRIAINDSQRNDAGSSLYRSADSVEKDVGFHIDNDDGKRDCGNITSGDALRGAGFASAQAAYDAALATSTDRSGGSLYVTNQHLYDTIQAKLGAELNPLVRYSILMSAFTSPTCAATVSNQTSGPYTIVGTDGKVQTVDYKFKTETVTVGYGITGDRNYECQTIANFFKNPSFASSVASYATQLGTATGRDIFGELAASNLAGDVSGEETCNLTGVGWLVCPVAKFGALITDGAYHIVEQLLVFKFADNAFDTSNPVYTIWNSVRNLANIGLILVFFVIILSQATGIGIGNYGIKKMLPRVIVSAILVNMSYFICTLGVDISNIIGAGIDGLIKAPLAGLSSSDPATWTSTITGLLAGGGLLYAASTATAAGVVGALSAALPFLVVALFAVFTMLVVLVARHALLILMIIISPLAMLAYILPNTQEFSSKWRKLFIGLLAFYPLVAVLFSGTQVAASVMRLTANDGGLVDQLIKLMSLGVQFFPLVAGPFLIKFLGPLGRLANIVNNPNKGPFDALRKRAENFRDTKQAQGRERVNKRPVPDFGGKRFGSIRKAAYNTYSPTARVRSRIDREKRLEEAKTAEAKSAAAYYAQRVGSDDAYAKKMAGQTLFNAADTGRLASIRGKAAQAIINLNQEEVKAHELFQTRTAAELTAHGFTLSADGTLSGTVNGATISLPNYGQGISTATSSAIRNAIGVNIGPSGLDQVTAEGMKYNTSNNLAGTLNGAKAIASTLASTGGLTSANVQALINGMGTTEEKSYLSSQINDVAQQAGMKHLSYTSVSTDGTFNIGGSLGGQGADVSNVVKRLMQNGVAQVTKDMYSDKAFGPQFAAAINQLEISNPGTFEVELARMDPRQLESFVQAKVDAGFIPAAGQAAALQGYLTQREDAVEKYGGKK